MSNTTPKKRSANLSKSRYTLSCQCLKAITLMFPSGIEPLSTAPEAIVLSVILWEHEHTIW